MHRHIRKWLNPIRGWLLVRQDTSEFEVLSQAYLPTRAKPSKTLPPLTLWRLELIMKIQLSVLLPGSPSNCLSGLQLRGHRPLYLVHDVPFNVRKGDFTTYHTIGAYYVISTTKVIGKLRIPWQFNFLIFTGTFLIIWRAPTGQDAEHTLFFWHQSIEYNKK